MMSNQQLCEALRVQGLSHYLPCAAAADRIEAQQAKIEQLEKQVEFIGADLFDFYYYDAIQSGARHQDAKINADKRLSHGWAPFK